MSTPDEDPSKPKSWELRLWWLIWTTGAVWGVHMLCGPAAIPLYAVEVLIYILLCQTETL